MKQQIIDLWKKSFGDSDEFIELFFNRVYKEENTLTIRKNNQVISALQIVPYEMTYYGAHIPVGYICGVCTLPSERGKGWMKQLMKNAFDEMYYREYTISTLIPASDWLFNYYQTFGYATVFDKSEEIHTRTYDNNEEIQLLPVTGASFDQAYSYYNHIQQKRKCAILHSAYDFETILRDCMLDGGNAWIAQYNGQVAGLALSVPTNNDELFVKEIIYDRLEIKRDIIQAVLNHYQAKIAKVRIPPTPTNSAPYGMAHILDRERLIQYYLSSDNHADEENIYLPDNSLSTQILFRYDQRQAYINLMLD